MVVKSKTAVWPLALLLWAAQSFAANIQVTVDRNPVGLDESFHIVFSASEQPDDEPDFTPLNRDFEIRSQGQSSQLSVVNGQYNRTIQWNLTAMAKRAGDLTIPSVAFGKDRSPAYNLRVESSPSGNNATAPAENSELFIEVEAEPKNPYVQAQVLYTVRILRQVSLSNARLEEPKLDNAVMERLSEDSQYETHRNGQPYQVIERRFAIFPQQSGRLTIQPPVLEADVGVGVGRHSLFNQFFSQQGAGDSVRLRGKAIDLDVRPVPPQFSGKHWLPAKSLTLSEALSKDPPQVAAGEPLTRTLKLQAQASTVGNLPELAPPAVEGLQAYPDQPALNEAKTPLGLNASREEKIALIPAQAGAYALAEVAIPWWNTATDRQEIARIPAHTLQATASGAAPPPTPEPRESPLAAQPAPPADIEPAAPSTPAAAPWGWIGLSIFLALGWLTTALAWWRKHRLPSSARSAVAVSAAGESSEREQRRRLRQACQANDAPSARAALLAWAQAHWRNNPPRHLDDVAARGGEALAREIASLNRASYGTTAAEWNGAGLAGALDKLSGDPPAARREGLEPLYRVN